MHWTSLPDKGQTEKSDFQMADAERLMACKTAIFHRQRGVSSIEYALVASLIAIAIVAGLSAVGGVTEFNWSEKGWVGLVLDALGV